jgi:hypothetical protein
MTADHLHRWRELRAWFDRLPPDDQEQLLGLLERFVAHAKARGLGAFPEWVDALFVLLERLETHDAQASGKGDPAGR